MNAIVLQRERRIAEIGSLCREGLVPGSFTHKAQTLLTFGWSRATWRSRAGILRTVDWLLDLERAHQGALQDQLRNP